MGNSSSQELVSAAAAGVHLARRTAEFMNSSRPVEIDLVSGETRREFSDKPFVEYFLDW